MTGYELYALLVMLGWIAYWRVGLLGWMFWNHRRWCYDWPDPANAPWMLAFLLTPLPGMVAICDLMLSAYRRMRRERLG